MEMAGRGSKRGSWTRRPSVEEMPLAQSLGGLGRGGSEEFGEFGDMDFSADFNAMGMA